jgi:hypothetical protein
MSAYLLQHGITVSCPHGGSGTVVAADVPLRLGGAPALLEDAAVTVTGCSFNVSGTPQPCVRVQWQAPATRVTVSGKAVLLSTSAGLCVNAAGAPQGSAQISGYQTKVSGV